MFQESLGGLRSVEQDGDDCIRPNAALEMRPQIRSKEQLKCMYSECWMAQSQNKIQHHHSSEPSTHLWERCKLLRMPHGRRMVQDIFQRGRLTKYTRTAKVLEV